MAIPYQGIKQVLRSTRKLQQQNAQSPAWGDMLQMTKDLQIHLYILVQTDELNLLIGVQIRFRLVGKCNLRKRR